MSHTTYRIEELQRKQARKRIEKNNERSKTNKRDLEMQTLPEPTLPQIEEDRSIRSIGYIIPNRPHYYQHPSSSNSSVLMPIDRQDSVSSSGSDQQGLITHAQGPSLSTTYYDNSQNYPYYSSKNIYYPHLRQGYF